MDSNGAKKSFTAKAHSREVILLLWSLRLSFLSVTALFLYQNAIAEEPGLNPVKVGIVEKLGQNIPLDLVFKDENGMGVSLGQVADGKPLIIDMAYYECPGICDVVMANLKNLIDVMHEIPGKDFNIATVSFSPADNPKLATRKKNQFWGKLDPPIPAPAWRFLTGDSTSIHELTNSLGFYFMRDKYGMFTHPTALILVDAKGKIVRYIQGTTFTLANVEMALREAKSGPAEQIIDSGPQVCFSHSPSGLVLADNVLKISGVGTLIFLAGFMVFIKTKKKFGKNQTGRS